MDIVTTDPTGGTKLKPRPAWVAKVLPKCRGCRDDFYNGRHNCNGSDYCWLMRPNYARLKGKPPCYH
mgnify:CR=1 FL=1